MARGYTAATATVTITESIVINDVDKSSTVSMDLGSVAEVKTGIIHVATDDTMVLQFGADNVIAATLTSIQYIRLTNLDNAYSITIRFHAAEDTFAIPLPAGKSVMFGSTDMDAASADIALSSINFGTPMTEISAKASTAADLEFFVIGAGG